MSDPDQKQPLSEDEFKQRQNDLAEKLGRVFGAIEVLDTVLTTHGTAPSPHLFSCLRTLIDAYKVHKEAEAALTQDVLRS